MRRATGIIAAFIVILALVAGYRVLQSTIIEDIYRDRLASVGKEFESLRSRYNDAVRSSAVTELWVKDGHLEVVIVTPAGVLQRFDTPYDPAHEIHVDFVVLESRLWIRRVHDGNTPPSQAVVIDPKLVDVPWDDRGQVVGLTVYRPLSDGRWVVTVTGNGALGLELAEPLEPTRLVARPPVREFSTIERELAADLAHVGLRDVARWVWKKASGQSD